MERTGEWVLLAGKTEYRLCGEYRNEAIEIRQVGQERGQFLDLEQLAFFTKVLEEQKK